MKRIKLHGINGEGRYALVSNEDYNELSKYRWVFQKDSKTKHLGYVYRCVKTKAIYMHRQILGDKKGFVCDHINRNTLDNRRENLRHLTPHESGLNRDAYTTKNRSPGRDVKGTTQLKSGKWQAQTRKKYLGTYKTFEEAREAYKKHMKESVSPIQE